MRAFAFLSGAAISNWPVAHSQPDASGDGTIEGRHPEVHVSLNGVAPCKANLSAPSWRSRAKWLNGGDSTNTPQPRGMEVGCIPTGPRARGKNWPGGQMFKAPGRRKYKAQLTQNETGVLSPNGCVLLFRWEQ
jgi:hypothetical protein